jgi:transposase-like protein
VEAVRLVVEGKRPVAEVVGELGIARSLLQRWKHQLEGAGVEAFPGNGKLALRLLCVDSQWAKPAGAAG